MPRATTQTHVSVPDHVITRLVAGSTVILDVDSGRSFTLDAVGSRVWALLVDTGSVASTLDRLQREFDADPAELERDVLHLVDELAAGALIDLTAA
ncbi:MAG: PqqD family protein [Vicinamibacterales bacterium]